MSKLYRGRLSITPISTRFSRFEYPNNGSDGFFCTEEVDGDVYYYTGKSKEAASASYPARVVRVLNAVEVV